MHNPTYPKPEKQKLKWVKKQIMCQSPPPVARMKSEKERNRKLEKAISLEGPSPPTMACLKIDAA